MRPEEGSDGKGEGQSTAPPHSRARLGRARSDASELLRREDSAETSQLRRVLQAEGRVDRRCACGSGADETRAHWRTECTLAAAAMGGVARATSEVLATLACAFWFDVGCRVGYWAGGGDDGEALSLARAQAMSTRAFVFAIR